MKRIIAALSSIVLLCLNASIGLAATDSNKLLEINYIRNEWNTSPTEKNHGWILVRTEQTGRTVAVELLETEVDSGIFKGVFRLQWDSDKVTPQIYTVDDLKGTSPAINKVKKQIERNEIARKPFFLRKDKKDRNIIQIFDRGEEARAALTSWQDRFKTQQNTAAETIKAAETARQAELQKAILLKEQQAQKEQEERQKMAQTEAQEQQLRLEKQKQLTEKKRAEQKAKAQALANQGMKDYQDQKYEEAQKAFKESLELDPENTKYSFQYGVTLFKLGQYNRSLVMLSLADAPDVDQNEKNYYQGLNYLKIEDYQKAKQNFAEVISKNAPVLASASAFYSGVIDYQTEDWKSAKESFQYVLDHSQDPRLDEQAETYIEQLAQMQKFEEMAKKKFIVSATAGLNYDSNILLSDDSSPDLGDATDVAGFRGLMIAGIGYRPFLRPTHDLTVMLGLTNMYSTDSSFSPNENLQKADPLLFNLSAPFNYKTSFKTTPYQLTLTPGYEILYLNSDGEDNGINGRELILNSIILMTDHNFVISEKYNTSIQLGLRSDDSQTEAATTEDNADALKINLKSSHTFFLNEAKNKAWTADFGYTLNQAQGDNYRYNRYELGFTYLTPAFWESIATANLSYFLADYPENPQDKSENNYTLSLGLSKSLTESLSSTYQLSYTGNESSIEGSDYNKISLTALLSWNGLF